MGTEPFVVKHYSGDDSPTLKGNTLPSDFKPEAATPALAAKLRVLASLKCTFPHAGKNTYGGGKKTSCCPVCGAHAGTYTYPIGRRWKHCFGCGYDRLEQELFEHARATAKRGQVPVVDVDRAISYHTKVFTGVSRNAL